MAEHERRRGLSQPAPQVFRTFQQRADVLSPRLPEGGERIRCGITEVPRADARIEVPDHAGSHRCKRLTPHQPREVGRERGGVDLSEQRAIVDPLPLGHPALHAGRPRDEGVQDERIAARRRPQRPCVSWERRDDARATVVVEIARDQEAGLVGQLRADFEEIVAAGRPHAVHPCRGVMPQRKQGKFVDSETIVGTQTRAQRLVREISGRLTHRETPLHIPWRARSQWRPARRAGARRRAGSCRCRWRPRPM